MTGLPVVTLTTNLLGRTATPPPDGDQPPGRWPLRYDNRAEVVAVFVDEGGALKLVLRGIITGQLGVTHLDGLRLPFANSL